MAFLVYKETTIRERCNAFLYFLDELDGRGVVDIQTIGEHPELQALPETALSASKLLSDITRRLRTMSADDVAKLSGPLRSLHRNTSKVSKAAIDTTRAAIRKQRDIITAIDSLSEYHKTVLGLRPRRVEAEKRLAELEESSAASDAVKAGLDLGDANDALSQLAKLTARNDKLRTAIADAEKSLAELSKLAVQDSVTIKNLTRTVQERVAKLKKSLGDTDS